MDFASGDGSVLKQRSIRQPRCCWLPDSLRYGEEVLFRSAEPASVALGIYDSVPTAHAEFRYEGTLSADGMTMTGKWRINGGGAMTIGGGETQIPTIFRQVDR